VLPYFYRATDELARNRSVTESAEFLAFVYMCFLLIHPLPDGNGRVARSLLRYYNGKLKLQVKDGDDDWYERLKAQPFHSKAFEVFFRDLSLPRLKEFGQSDPYPIPRALESHLGRMADCLIDWAESLRHQREHLDRRRYVQIMSQGILSPVSGWRHEQQK
jgi:hypothetical protein